MRRRGDHPATNERGHETPPPQAKAGKTTICHSTGSETNPFVEITVSNNALKAHARHHDGHDIIPAPEEGCEAATATSRRRVAARGGVRAARRTAADAGVKRTRAADGAVLGAQASRGGDEQSAGDLAEEENEDDSLPFTGLGLIAILAIALLALVGGVAARRAAA